MPRLEAHWRRQNEISMNFLRSLLFSFFKSKTVKMYGKSKTVRCSYSYCSRRLFSFFLFFPSSDFSEASTRKNSILTTEKKKLLALKLLFWGERSGAIRWGTPGKKRRNSFLIPNCASSPNATWSPGSSFSSIGSFSCAFSPLRSQRCLVCFGKKIEPQGKEGSKSDHTYIHT